MTLPAEGEIPLESLLRCCRSRCKAGEGIEVLGSHLGQGIEGEPTSCGNHSNPTGFPDNPVAGADREEQKRLMRRIWWGVGDGSEGPSGKRL
jgi:hypothetical protein